MENGPRRSDARPADTRPSRCAGKRETLQTRGVSSEAEWGYLMHPLMKGPVAQAGDGSSHCPRWPTNLRHVSQASQSPCHAIKQASCKERSRQVGHGACKMQSSIRRQLVAEVALESHDRA